MYVPVKFMVDRLKNTRSSRQKMYVLKFMMSHLENFRSRGKHLCAC